MRRHLGLAAVDVRLVKTGLDDGDFGVVRHQQAGNPADRRKGSGVGADPIAEPLRPARLGIGEVRSPITATKICAARVSPVRRSMITGTMSPA
jgi:hypothetical protein